MTFQTRLTVRNAKSFYIGKTGKTIANKYNDDYKDEYGNIDQVISSEHKKTIEHLETRLIGYFENDPYYANRLDNKSNASHGDMKTPPEGGAYRLYVVWDDED